MVGVPNRKKCHCCRRRKIKCDEETPSCGQCRKGAIVCQGYDAAPVFKNQSYSKNHLAHQNQKVLPAVVKWRQLETPQRRRSYTHHHHGGDRTVHGSAAALVVVQTHAQVSQQRIDSSPCPPMSLYSWSHDSLVQEFVSNFLPAPGAKRYCLFAWLGDIIHWKEGSDITHLALTAPATGWAGRVDGRPDLVGKGLQMYRTAAHLLCHQIPSCRPPLIFATTGVFILYELFEFGAHGNAGWAYHMAGAAASVRAAMSMNIGVAPFVHVFEFCRMIFLMNCLRSRRQHQSVWIDHAESASTYDNETKSLVRLGFEGVRLLEMADGIELGLSHQSPQLVVGQLFKFLVKLAQWEESNDLVIKTGPLNALDSISYPHHGLRGFPGRLGRLKDPVPHDYAHDARLMQLYYTIRLIIFMTILGNPGLRLVLRNTAQVSQSIDEWSTEEATLEAIISRLTKEADTAANYICMYAQILFPTVGATFGYMYELWALETVSEWHQQSLSSDKTPTAEGNSHRYIDICRSIIPLIKLRMSDKVIRADSSG